jgi:predicted DNA binding CopG/RHH family protein
MPITKLTVRIDSKLLKNVKTHVAAKGISVQDFVVSAIEARLPKVIHVEVTTKGGA